MQRAQAQQSAVQAAGSVGAGKAHFVHAAGRSGLSFAPILVPIVLMGVASGLSMTGIIVPVIVFLGTPVIALAVGVIISLVLR